MLEIPRDMNASISQELQMPSQNDQNYIDSNCNRRNRNYSWYKNTNNKQQPTFNNQSTTNKQQPKTNNQQPTTAVKNLQSRRFQFQNAANSIANGQMQGFQLPNAENNMQNRSLPKILKIEWHGSFQFKKPAYPANSMDNMHSQNSQKELN